MDVVIDSRFSGMYAFKLARFMSAWIAIVIARKFFSDDYISRVVVNENKPKPLTFMVLIFLGIQICFDIIIVTLLLLLSNLRRRTKVSAFVFPMLHKSDFMTTYIVDMIGTTALSGTICWTVANIVGSRVRFDYVTQGTRAARTLEEMMVNVVAISYLVPFFLLI